MEGKGEGGVEVEGERGKRKGKRKLDDGRLCRFNGQNADWKRQNATRLETAKRDATKNGKT